VSLKFAQTSQGLPSDPPGTVLRGYALSPGYGEGAAYVYHSRVPLPVPRRPLAASEIPGEKARLDAAILASVAELEQVRERILSEFGEAESEIIASHLAFVKDPDFIAKVEKRIEGDLVNAEFAVQAEADDAAALLARADSHYLRERAADIFDLKQRVLKHLGHGAATRLRQLPPGTVLVARELLPTDTLTLDRAHVSGLALEHGAPTSHAAILARAMGIPAVSHLPGLMAHVRDGVSVLVDGERGELIVDPLPGQILSFGAARRSYDAASARATEGEASDCVTEDGVSISLLANIGRPAEAEQVRRHHLDGVGLFQTEYLFLESTEPPTLEHQRQVYASVLAELRPRPLVIRTLDLGGDKTPSFPISALRGSASSIRGLRLSLREATLFTGQIQAILEASFAASDVAVLLPMVLCAEDFRQAKEMFEDLASTARPERRPPLGAMIETPSALFELDEILELCDFVSVGTNDLAQFMLAIERRSVQAFDEDAVFQPAILRALHRVVRAAERYGKPVTLCGEVAGDARCACLLAGIGFRRLSMSPVRAARVRAALRAHRYRDLRALAEEALESKSREQVARVVQKTITLE
jgi:phosphotransferase system enzyme I (PtsI)